MIGKQEHNCKVCGYKYTSFPCLGELCPSCGAEIGFDDCSLEQIRDYRSKWLAEGGQWHAEAYFTKEKLEEAWELDVSIHKSKKTPYLIHNKETWLKDNLGKVKAPVNWNREEQMKNIPPEWL